MKKEMISRILILLFLMFGGSSFSVLAAESDVVIVIRSESANSFVITAHDPIGGGYVGDLSVNVWSAINGKDDIKTEVMNYTDGKYLLTVSNADHHNDKGQYYIQLTGPSGLLKTDFTALAVDGNEWIRITRDSGGNIVKLTCRAILEVTPTISNSTQEANSGAEFKSGYGYTATYNSAVTSNVEVDADRALTGAGNARLTFSEFNFDWGVSVNSKFSQFNRLTDCTNRNDAANIANSILELKENPFSAANKRVHFTPIWYPDNTTYTVFTEIFDAWTPGGVLSTVVTNNFTVNGNVYDDWQVNQTK